MLRHEDLSQTTTPSSAAGPAAQVRVSAEELARAVARYQDRRDEAAKRLEGTLTLGEAIQELGLDMTPEELLTEVQADRVLEVVPGKIKISRPAVFAGILVMLIFFSGVMMLAINTEPTQQPIPVISLPRPSAPHQVLALATILVQDNSGPQPILRTLGEIPEARPVRAALDQTDSRAAFVQFSDPTTSWTLIKYGGRVYVRAWMAAMSSQAMRVNAVSLYRDKSLVPSGIAPQAITLRLDSFQCIPSAGDDDTIVARNIHADSHFAESWSSQK